MERRKKRTVWLVTLCGVAAAVLLVLGTLWVGLGARNDTDRAVREVSLLYLDELAGRREQVVENNLRGNIRTIRVAIELLTGDDLRDKAHLEAYQSRMKKLYDLEKFAFVDTNGVIYTSSGTQDNVADYGFDYKNLGEPEISVFNAEDGDRKIVVVFMIAF